MKQMINIQPNLENDLVELQPLNENDFEALYLAASDPKVWEQHPNKNRWKRDVFMNFFEGAIQSKGAFKIIDKQTNQVVGSSRFYDYNEQDSSILVGYTFYSTNCWGKGFNPSVKKLMFDYIFQFVDKIYLHVGADNVRSQIAVERLGCKKVKEEQIEYFGEESKLNFIYQLNKVDWFK
ncbi:MULTISPECIES: GNAT family N-acetyltransferase [unclassified Empedobacter]|uniref:GNAT family N-acetyltransferase n=1 Tax=unclassified Empedobacter TaxID=2643773 RepID=UPI0028A74AF4|nr:GNAT family N-acetyltransferase [Empedobacter sp.]